VIVADHRDARLVERDRAVAFVDFADEHVAASDQGACEGGIGSDEILHHRSVHDRGIAARAWRIQPIIPVVVDLPLVPPQAIAVRAS
jgi:hypothetical protein